MRGNCRFWLAAGAVLLGLLAPRRAQAGPFIGNWSWCCPSRNCPRGYYSPLHYWAPELYKMRAYCHPSNLDQYPPGPCPPVPVSFHLIKYPCRTTPPAPSPPYADPAGYYGLAPIRP